MLGPPHLEGDAVFSQLASVVFEVINELSDQDFDRLSGAQLVVVFP